MASSQTAQEWLAEALAIQRLHGDGAPVWIAIRIGALALAGDTAGVERFRAVAVAYEMLLGSTVQRKITTTAIGRSA